MGGPDASPRPRSRSRPRPTGSGGSGAQGAANGKAEAVVDHDHDKEAPHFQWVRGMKLGPGGQYVVRRLLGEGTFGRVLSCVDMDAREAVAVKVVRGVKRYCEHAEAEAEVLREIARCDPGCQSRCVQLRGTFLHPRYHYCLVFERLDVSIRDFLKENKDQGMLLSDVRSVAAQLLQCVSFLHAIGLTHTDLKCRNVMFRDGRHDVVPLPRSKGAETRKLRCCEIVVIDFGGALFKDERHEFRIGTRHYRSPEVVLGLPWSEQADIWSVGCLIAMVYLGFRPFCMSEDMEHLAFMEKFVGQQMPRKMMRDAAARGNISQGVAFDAGGRLQWPQQAPNEEEAERMREAMERVQQAASLKEQIRGHHGPLLDLLEGLLQLDPTRRIKAEAATELPFIANEATIPE